MTVTAICPSCRQPCHGVGEPCQELGCKHKGYHGVPPDCVEGRVDPRVGLLLADKYLLVRLLGKGGMGVVMIALQQPLLREVALKVISGVTLDDAMRARFTREARAVASLDHPNVVKLVDFGVAHLDEEAPFMVMELVSEAESLRKVFSGWRKDPPTWRAFGEVFGQLLSALQAAHDKGIIHRDIKPDNVMAKRASGYDHFIKVLDFGLAKSFEGKGELHDADMPSLTESGQLVGTPMYMAPEQLSRAQIGRIDARVDVYAVGVMMFEVLLGRRPYLEQDTLQLVVAKLDPYRDALLDVAAVDGLGPMAPVLRQAMAWDPAQRYASVAELRAEMTAAVAAIGIDSRLAPAVASTWSADSPTMMTPATGRGSSVPAMAAPDRTLHERPAKGRPVAPIAAGLALVALVAGGWFVLHKPEPRQPNEPVVGQPSTAPVAAQALAGVAAPAAIAPAAPIVPAAPIAPAAALPAPTTPTLAPAAAALPPSPPAAPVPVALPAPAAGAQQAPKPAVRKQHIDRPQARKAEPASGFGRE